MLSLTGLRLTELNNACNRNSHEGIKTLQFQLRKPCRTQLKFIAWKSAMYKTTKEKLQSATPKIPSFISLNLPALVTPDH